MILLSLLALPVSAIIQPLLKEGELVHGLSSGIDLAGAGRLARKRGPGQIVMTLPGDSGIKYLSRMFKPVWSRDRHLYPALPLESVLENRQ